MARHKHKNTGRFAGIPNFVVKSDAYKSLGGNAGKLLTILTCFYTSYNNGNLAITQSIIGEWMTKNTMYSAKDELHKKGFIVINAYGGRSAWGRKLPSLYGLTFYPMNELEEKNGELRFAHYPPDQSSLNYWREGKNPDYKTMKERDAQYKKDINKIKKTNPNY
tara:strand:- start:78 stop:569 length:492 start_codon:yes stop_codon:yes gene_type:complete